MADTIPNIIIERGEVVDIYADTGVIAAGLTVGTKINVAVIAGGEARLYSGAVAPAEINQETGYVEINKKQSLSNDTGDLGAFISSVRGCTINAQGA